VTGRRAGGAAALVLGLALAACGVPTGGAPSTIDPTDVPYGLASPSPAPTPTPAPEAVADTSRVHWVAADDTVVPREREAAGSTRRERLTSLLGQLATGPTPAEREEQLSTALPPEIGLTVTALDQGTASIDLEVAAQALSGVSGRRAVAQIVLTATSVPGVEAVLLELAGQPVEAPLPAGALTARPLTAGDYAAFATPTPEAAPGPRVEPAPPPVPAVPVPAAPS
jgi:hypothetical protein